MNNRAKRIAGLLLSIIIATAYFPAAAWAVDNAFGNERSEAAASAAASSDVSDDSTASDEPDERLSDDELTEQAGTDEALTKDPEEITPEDSEQEVLRETEDENIEKNESTDKNEINNDPEEEADADAPVIDENIQNGTLSAALDENGRLSGTAVPDAGFDLATVRLLGTDESGQETEQYIEYSEEDGAYSFGPVECDGFDTVTACFYDLKKWDGAVDISWYDPDNTEFEIGTPAELAGLAAIVNGMVDVNVTEEYKIKDVSGRTKTEDGYAHEYISTEPALANLLTPNAVDGAVQVRDTVWRLPEVEHNKVNGASDDIHNDFLYRTVRLTADIDMGEKNWTPIGGKYAMNRDATLDDDPKVIDTRFQGIFDGCGHKVSITCDRQALKGYAYAMEIALIGYLGGGVDYKNGYPKDTCMDYENYWIPTVRNLTVDGSIKGRRMVGGIVGRTGETNYGVLVENCANFASVTATDMRGCAGIVGAAWGKTIIRNCYNKGAVNSNFWEHGGIVGSNGYEGSEGRDPAGADIYNCYNIGEIKRQGTYAGQDIGVDGEAFASYRVSNCYYLIQPEGIKDESGYCTGYSTINRRAKVSNVEAMGADEMRSADMLGKLNANGGVFAMDSANINDGYPVLWFQTAEYASSPQSYGTASVTLAESEGGSVSSPDKLTDLPYGTSVELTAAAERGKRHNGFTVIEGGESKTIESGNFYTVTGKDVEISGIFGDRQPSVIAFPEEEDGEDYYVKVVKVSDADDGECNVEVNNGDSLKMGDVILLTPVMKPLDSVHPDIKNLEYTGKFGDPVYNDYSLEVKDKVRRTYTVTGETEVVEISYKPKTQGKRWTTVADTSWYKDGVKTFTITNARQLSGLALLCNNGTDFTGVTVKLGNDIELQNTLANSGDDYGYERSWVGIGIASRPFTGTFDGQGFTVRYMHRNFAPGYCDGDNGGLFGVTEGAVIKNVRVEGGSYINDVGVEMECSFINGANGGAIAGDAIDTVIQDCSADLSMENAFHAGGIAGTVEGTTVIRRCVSDCRIRGKNESIGGIAGRIDSAGGAEISDCVNNGSISSSSWKAGGILGDGGIYNASVIRCINNGDLTLDMKGTSSNAHAAGGVIGYSNGTLSCDQCVNTGSITGLSLTYAIGGIAGTMLKGSITNCYNTGDLRSESTSRWAQLSGIANVGISRLYTASVKNCYNTGKITKSDSYGSSNYGGAVAYGSAVTNVISEVYCSDESVADIEEKAGVAGTVVPADELRTYGPKFAPEFVSDISGLNDGYPVLVWQVDGFLGTAKMTKVSKSTDTALTAAWSKSGQVDGVELWRATSKTGKYTKVYTGSKTSYKNSKLTYGKTYYYKVRPYRTVDGAKYYGDWSGIKSYSLVPAKPALSSVRNTASKSAVIKWKKVSGASGYQIYRSLKKSSGYKKVGTVKKGSTVTYTDKKLKKGKTYYYKIRSYKTVSKKTGYSEYSAVKYVKIKK